MKFLRYFTPFEYALWGCSVLAIVLSFVLCGNRDYFNLIGSLFGATTLMFTSKGNVVGQFMAIVFSVFYGYVSYRMHYYGELITYVGMSAPMSAAAIVSWLRHPHNGKKTEVHIGKLKRWEYPAILLATAAVTAAFYFILRALGTARLIWSTVSVATSFLAVALTLCRTPFYAAAYALNDIVLIILWSLAVHESTEYVALAVCFGVFLACDIYGFYNWLKMRRRQSADQIEAPPPAPEEPPHSDE